MLAIGVIILTAQLVAMIVNGFAGLLTSLFQATGRSVPGDRDVDGQGVLFIPIVLLGNLWFGLAGIIWSLTVTEGLVFLVGVVMWLAVAPCHRPRPRRGQRRARRGGARAGGGVSGRL